MKLIAVLAFVLAAPQEKNEAEELFKKMEQKILKSESVKFSFEVTMTEKDRLAEKRTGSAFIQRGDRMLIDAMEKDKRIKIISDGERVHMDWASNPWNPTPCAVPAGITREALQGLIKMGGFGAVDAVQGRLYVLGLEEDMKDEGKPPQDPVDEPKISFTGFKLAPGEKIGDRETQVITFVMKPAGQVGPGIDTTLWIDKETLAPLKRRMEGVQGKDRSSLEEVLAGFTFDAKAEAGTFALPKNAAEELFLAMEAKLTNATSVRMKFEHEFEVERFRVKGEVLLGDGNRGRVEFKGTQLREKLESLVLSDGRKIHRNPGRENENPAFATPATLGRRTRLALARGGFFGIVPMWNGDKDTPDLRAAEFKMGVREKVDGRDAQAVNYKVSSVKDEKPVTATVWIDVETLMPIRRRIKAFALYETYLEFKIDEKIDPAKFELPK